VAGVTVAVRVTLCPKGAVGSEDAAVTLETTRFTVCESAGEMLGASLASPP
jgi:hypothetical protein